MSIRLLRPAMPIATLIVACVNNIDCILLYLSLSYGVRIHKLKSVFILIVLLFRMSPEYRL